MRLVLAIGLAATLAAGPLRACEGAQTKVEEVYPTATALPENLLRFYIYFSAPMGRDDIAPAVDLLDAQGRVVEGVFLTNRFDLWSADRTRLTLLLNPGRVKTGLAANLALGRALVAGETYTLQISRFARDAKGCPLARPHRVTFQAVPADVSTPAPQDWKITVPGVGTRTPLTVELDGPVDHLSLAYRLRVIGPDGAPVPGRIGLDAGETRWQFTPRAPWPGSPHRITIDPQLEDLAGNRPGALFDQPMDAPRAAWSPSLDWSPTRR
ncbi:MAG: hypothetical protein AAFX45_02500 [Pseudomonadota bacterium]